MTSKGRRSFGVIGGFGPLGSADVASKLALASSGGGEREPVEIAYDPRPFGGAALLAPDGECMTERKLYLIDAILDFARRGIDTVILPCFFSHTFIDELQANSPLVIVDMIDAVRSHVLRTLGRAASGRAASGRARRIGVLATAATREARLFERYFASPGFEVLHPRRDDGDRVTEAVYGEHGIRSGQLFGLPIALLDEACADLVAQGAEVIVPGATEIALIANRLAPLAAPILDTNSIYARHALHWEGGPSRRPFKVGVVGGVGPAATVDFMQKIVASTPAARDQDHIKLIVEQNPQIPDRTGYLVGDGPDPTLSLYATCKKLEAGHADIIAIPCNTAHAYVDRIQPRLSVPIVNMLTETVAYLRERFPRLREVGVLATTGTVASGVYRRALAAQGLYEVVPGAELQARVMNAIYGEKGVKAGFTSGQCVADIRAAAAELAERGVQAIILGCTELPLLLPEPEFESLDGARAALVDPTAILAKRCVARALEGAAHP
ncbi:aspartate/glutamate racemase family protein [Trinickia terrae]|uniref:Aspartate/glutamate racemase family protein n=2 Tax=Trinickia terrae TaxID=2571161 RepID=A0A4U1IE20_9BURK|nr:aspartate/glutamate racemase family protein [Trinickia terrae]